MRCPKCGSELDLKLMECDRCGLATPQGKPKPKEEKKDISSTSLPKVNKKKSTWLPAFLAKSSLNKIKVPPVVIILAILIFPMLAGGYYLFYESGICINCLEVGGLYTTNLDIDERPVRLEVSFYQYGSIITGYVKFSPEVDPTDKTAKKEIFMENLEEITINQKEILFKSRKKNDVTRVKFSGLVEESKTLKGNIIVTIPELNCNERSFPVSIKKS